jgi:hypothetical protein
MFVCLSVCLSVYVISLTCPMFGLPTMVRNRITEVDAEASTTSSSGWVWIVLRYVCGWVPYKRPNATGPRAACAACEGKKGRAEFGKSHLDRKRRGHTYLLLCSICYTREKELLERLRKPEVWKCTKKCVFGHGHVTACKANPYWYGYSRNPVHCVTRDELRFLHFRTENRKYH